MLNLEQYLSLKVVKELFMVVVEGDECVFTVSDALRITPSKTVEQGLLDHFQLYYLATLNYPTVYKQILAFFQAICLGQEFLQKVRVEFVKLRESLKENMT